MPTSTAQPLLYFNSSSFPVNTTSANDDDEDDYTVRNIFVIVFYSLIVCVSLCGNLLVLRVVFGKQKMRTTTNILISCLALSDCLTTTLNIPFNVSRFLLYNWPFGKTFCVLGPFVQVCCVYVSTLTMAVIAIHRWFSVSSRSTGSKSLSYCQLGAIIISTWLIAGGLAVPFSFFNNVVLAEYKNQSYLRCRVIYPQVGFDLQFWLSIEGLLTQYIIPLSVTCILYVKIGFIVSRQGHLAGNSSDERRMRQSEARRRRIIMLFLVVAVFAACWFPLNVYHLLVDFKLIRPNFNLFLICHWIAMSSVCYNPFIYCWLNESFRKGAKKLFRIICWCCFTKPNQDQRRCQAPDEITRSEMNNGTRVKEFHCEDAETKTTQV